LSSHIAWSFHDSYTFHFSLTEWVFRGNTNHPLLAPILIQVGRFVLISQRRSSQSCFAVLSHKYEFADAAEALLSVLALPNGTTISSADTALLAFVETGVFDIVGEAGGVVRVGERGRKVDFC